MKQLNELLPDPNQITVESCDSSEKPAPALNPRTVRLFEWFGAKYGHRWTSLITDDGTMELLVRSWAEDLAGIPDDAMRAAIQKCPTEFPDWPPTSGQFKQLCMVGRDPLMQPGRQLPKGIRDDALALSALGEMKRILKVK